MLDVAAVLAATGARVLELSEEGRQSRSQASRQSRSEASQLVPGELSPADLQAALAGVSIDSRSVTPGSLFVALRGERVDGHDYVAQALQSGALAAMVSRLPDAAALAAGGAGLRLRSPRDSRLFLVPDTVLALQRLANYWRRRHAPEVIGITGSIGKTTAKEIVASVLASRWPVLKSEANFNTEIGLPLAMLKLTPEHRVAVLEMGMYAPGDVALLARTAEPRIGIVTNVAPIHLERMQTLERIARAKSELVAALPPDGLAILNGDDPWTRAMARTSGVAPIRLIGSSPDCDYRAIEVKSHGLEGLAFSLETEGRRIRLRTRVPGTHTLHAFLAAVAAARALGMHWNEILQAVEEARLDVRQRVLHGPDGTLIIDDSYNAAPHSMNAALDLLAAAPGTRIAVLGDMLELGPQEEAAHRQVGERAAEVADWLVLRGRRSGWIAEGARQKGLAPERILHAEHNLDAVQAVRTITSQARMATARAIEKPRTDAHAGGTHTMARTKRGPSKPELAAEWSVLVKGSRGMRMEEVVQGLRGEACS